MWYAHPWFSWLLQVAGVSWDTRRQIDAHLLRPEGFLIVSTAIGVVAYVALLACCAHRARATFVD
jgi:hypothetical protein